MDFVEKKLKLKVVIAAHPKSEYDKIGNKFNGRKIRKGKTIELMKDAKLILTHDSSVSFYASVFEKTMVFLTNDNINNDTGFYGENIKMYADMLGCPVINVDHNIDIEPIDFLSVKCDEEKCESYKYNYVTNRESENENSGNIVVDEINRLCRSSFG